MKTIELLKFTENFLQKISGAGIRAEDVQYIPLYDEYCKMKAEGNKITYIVAVLSEKYSVSERNVYYLVKRFETCI